MNLIVESWFAGSTVRHQLTKQLKRFIALRSPPHVYPTMSAQHRLGGCYQREHPIDVFSPWPPCSLLFDIFNALLLVIESGIQANPRSHVLVNMFCSFVAIFIFHPPIGIGDTILLLCTVIQWFSSSQSKLQRASPALFPPRVNGPSISHVYRPLLLSLSVRDCAFVNASAFLSCFFWSNKNLGSIDRGRASAEYLPVIRRGSAAMQVEISCRLNPLWHVFASDQDTTNKSKRYGNTGCLCFFLRHVGVHALCICLWKVIGACCYLCYLFFSSFSCVCAFVPGESGGWVTPGGQAPAHFLSLSCVPQLGGALSPAIYLPALCIVIPKYRPVTISLVTATSPPATQREKKKEKKKPVQGRRCSLLSLLLRPYLAFS